MTLQKFLDELSIFRRKAYYTIDKKIRIGPNALCPICMVAGEGPNQFASTIGKKYLGLSSDLASTIIFASDFKFFILNIKYMEVRNQMIRALELT